MRAEGRTERAKGCTTEAREPGQTCMSRYADSPQVSFLLLPGGRRMDLPAEASDGRRVTGCSQEGNARPENSTPTVSCGKMANLAASENSERAMVTKQDIDQFGQELS